MITVAVRKELSPELFRWILNQGSNAIFILDPDTGDIIDVNQTASDMLGWSEDELLRMNISDLEGEFTDTLSWLSYIDGMRDQQGFTIKGRHRRKDDSSIPVEVDIDLISAPGREYVLATVRNRDEIEEKRDDIINYYSHYRTLFNNSPVGLWEFDLSEAPSYLSELHRQHSGDFMDFLDDNPEVLDETIDRVDLLDVNDRSLEIFEAENRSQLLDNLETFVTDKVRNQLKKDILHLLNGNTKRQAEYQTRSLSGEDLHLFVDYEITPGPDEDSLRMFVAFIDITERKDARRALRSSEERYRTLFEKAKVGMAEVSMDEEWLRVNERLQEILGYTEQEFLEMDSCAEITHPDDLPRDRRKAETLLEGDIDRFSIEKRYQKKDGGYLWTRLTASLVEPEGDQQPHMVSIIEDISQQKEYKNELEKSEEKFRQLAENIKECFWLIEPHEGIVYVSPAFEDIWGRELGDDNADLEDWLESIHPEDRSRIKTNLAQRHRTGEYDEEYRVVRPDGSIRWVHDRAFPIRDDEGEVVRIAGLAEDITKRKKLRKQQEAFFDLSLDLFAISDTDGNFLKVNSAFEEKLGYSEEELRSRSYLEFVHPDDREETREKMAELERGNNVRDFENRYRTSDGDYRWLNWRSIPLNDYVYAAARDVTKRRERERRLQAALEEKEILMGEIHHRVKNNLQIVSSILDMKKRTIENEDLTDELLSCVNRIKSMALIHEKLYQSDNLDHLDLSQYLRDLSEHLIVLHSHDADRITFEYDLASEPIKLDKAIPCGLILNELLTNALDYAYEEDQSGTIRVSADFEESRGVLVVEDNGSGLPETVRRDNESTFGLDLVDTLAEYELNGGVSIDSENGTRIEVEFPVDDPTD